MLEYSYDYDDGEPLLNFPNTSPTSLKKESKLNALAQGAIIGTTTGAACAYSDKVFPFNWLICIWLRAIIIDTISDKRLSSDAEQHAISTTAWLADWLAYILLKLHR